MQNPIMQALKTPTNNNIFAQLSNIKNPQAMFNNMLNNNAQFRQFVEANKGKTPEQIAKENGIDPAILAQFLK